MRLDVMWSCKLPDDIRLAIIAAVSWDGAPPEDVVPLPSKQTARIEFSVRNSTRTV